MNFQPGAGYGFTSSGYGVSLDSSNPFPDGDSNEFSHPFKVISVSYDAAGSVFTFQVVPGTLNNKVAQIEEDSVWVLLDRTTAGVPNWPVSVLSPFDPTTKKCYIYLRAGSEAAAPFAFPDPVEANATYPKVICSDVQLADSDTYGYLLLAVATEAAGPTVSVVQYVTGSLWADRIKINGMTARYYYARI